MLRRLTCLLLTLPLFWLGCGRSYPTEEELVEDEVVRFNEAFEVAVNERVVMEETGIQITFPFVSEDNRCALGLNCARAGAAGVLLRVKEPNGEVTKVVLIIPGLVATPYTANSSIFHAGYYFKLLQLDPYPVNGVNTDPEAYHARMIIETDF